MTPEQIVEFKKQFGAEAATEMQKLADAIEKRLNDAWANFQKGLITPDEFEEIKKEVKGIKLEELNQKLADLEEVAKTQGNLINELKEKGGKDKTISLTDFFESKIEQIKEMRKARSGFFEVTGAELKAAGVTSISGSVQDMDAPPGSPYLPGIGGPELQIFEIQRNPNFILNHVNVGRTNQVRLAWINETAYEGTPGTEIAEAGAKPLTQHKFKVEFSTAKKAAAYIELTEEFDADVPGLATAVRRMLSNDVIRAFDDQVQANVIAVARPYEIAQLDGAIQNANLWSALRAMQGQVGYYNFQTNTFAINPLTGVKLDEQKSSEGTYLLPPYMASMRAQTVEANKVAVDYALVGDLKQYNVDILKDLVISVGWINDNFINNKFCVLAEMRYHSYISDNRKKAICYDSVEDVKDQIDGGDSV